MTHWSRRSTGSDTDGGGGGTADMITQRMDKEAEILRKLKHPNIIGFRGFKRTSDGSRILAIENGQRALFDIIEDRRDSEDILAPLEASKVLVVIREALNLKVVCNFNLEIKMYLGVSPALWITSIARRGSFTAT